MNKKTKREYARYRTNGFVLDLISKGLGIEQKEASLQKRYQRFIKEEDLSADEYHDTFNTIIEDILLIFFDSNKSQEYEDAELLVKEFFKLFNIIKTTNEASASSQKQLDFITIMTLFIPFIAFNKLKTRWIICAIIPDKDENAIQKLFNLIEPSFDKPIKELLKNILDKNKDLGYDSINKLVNNWLNGESVPDNRHIDSITKIIDEDSNDNKMTKKELKNFLFLAKILDSLFNKSKEYFGEELTNLLAMHYESMYNFNQLYLIHQEEFENILKKKYLSENFINIKQYLDVYFYNNLSLISEVGEQSSMKDSYFPSKYSEYIQYSYNKMDIYYYMDEKVFFETIYRSMLRVFHDINKPIDDSLVDKGFIQYSEYLDKLHINTSIDRVKNKESEHELILEFEEFEKNYDTQEDPYYNFLKARYYAQKKEIKKSIKHYLIALKYGKNCMGSHIKDVIKEGLFVSAQETRKKEVDLINAKSDFTKFYKEAYFYNLRDDLPEEINTHFLLQMKKKFDSYFYNLYPNTKKAKDGKIARDMGFVNQEDAENIKLDLKNPNKLIKNIYKNDVTQLFHFAPIGNIEAVKDLIKAGANINYVRKHDNVTALMCVLEHNITDILEQIAKILIPKMTPSIINSKLTINKETALSYAIKRGLVDIVDLLIKHGANLEEKDTLDEQSALYHSMAVVAILQMDDNINMLDDNGKFKITIPTESKKERKKMMKTHDNSSTIFDYEKEYNLDNPIYHNNDLVKSIREKIQKVGCMKKNVYHSNLENAYKVFDSIIDSSDRVDIPHRYNFSPLIYATEVNDVYLVKRLLEKGANPDWAMNQNLTAHDYALKNGNLEIIELLENY